MHAGKGLVLLATLLFAALPPLARARSPPASTVWTAVIPGIFPRYVYTWRLLPDGRYLEDGRDGQDGPPVQPTLSGRWSRDGARLVLRQDGIGYVFDGVEAGASYSGILRLEGKAVSRFCARQGARAPIHCDPPGV